MFHSSYHCKAKFEDMKWSVIGNLLGDYRSFNVGFINNQFIAFGSEIP